MVESLNFKPLKVTDCVKWMEIIILFFGLFFCGLFTGCILLRYLVFIGSQQTDLFRTLIPYLNIQPHNIILNLKENLSNEKFYKETNTEKQDQIRKNMLRLFAILFLLIIIVINHSHDSSSR